jgi:hypothetical protein
VAAALNPKPNSTLPLTTEKFRKAPQQQILWFANEGFYRLFRLMCTGLNGVLTTHMCFRI